MHGQGNASDVVGSRADKEDDGPGEFIRFTPASMGNTRFDEVVAF
jgi:hypothetical protein